MGHVLTPNIPQATPGQGADDEVIPTAIVIKNIPFNVKRETLLDIIVSDTALFGFMPFTRLLGFSFYPNAICIQLSPRPVGPVPWSGLR